MAQFFYAACEIDEIEIIELLARRYHDAEIIMNLSVQDFTRFIKIAKDKEKEERCFMQWVVQLPFMTKDSFTSFEQYKDNINGKNIETRSTDTVLAELDEIERQFGVAAEVK